MSLFFECDACGKRGEALPEKDGVDRPEGWGFLAGGVDVCSIQCRKDLLRKGHKGSTYQCVECWHVEASHLEDSTFPAPGVARRTWQPSGRGKCGIDGCTCQAFETTRAYSERHHGGC